jgi:perosamine synthetase
MSFLKPIATSLSPNTEKDDISLAFKLKFQPWKWKGGQAVDELEREFKKYLGVKYAVSFNSGRSALLAILDALGIKKGDEVLSQAFTCNSAVNPTLKKGALPVFVDIDDTLNLDPSDLCRKISHHSKAVMVQHNFGWPAKMDEIQRIAKEKNLFLIEDCAHSPGAEFKGRLCGTFGKAAFFSFGRDKAISSVFGGMAVTDDVKMGERLKGFQEKLNFPSNFWILQQLLHPIMVNYLILPAYGLNQYLGRILLGFFHKASLLSKAVYKREKKGKLSRFFPARLPNALAVLALNQFKKLERFNEHRRKVAGFYEKELKSFDLPLAKPQREIKAIFMRYPVLVKKDTDDILRESRKERIFLDDGWRKGPVIPPDTEIKKMHYISGSCPKAERIAQSVLNLPTHINISEKEAKKIASFLKNHGN